MFHSFEHCLSLKTQLPFNLLDNEALKADILKQLKEKGK